MTRDESNSDAAFGFRQTKDGHVRISYRGRVVTTLSGYEAKKFLDRIQGAGEKEVQLAMAKATGNFRRGNERDGKDRGKR